MGKYNFLLLVLLACSSSSFKMSMSSLKNQNKVCIVGGGFGGLYSALKTAEKYPELDITLIDNKDKFVFLPLLYELVTGTASVEEVAPSFDFLLKKKNIGFLQATVQDIDLEQKVLRSIDSNGTAKEITYDQLVIASGTQARMEITGATDNALPFYTVQDAYQLKLKLRALVAQAQATGTDLVRCAVVGGGYSGVETATSLAEYLGRKKAVVSIIDRNDRIMQNSPDSNREAAEKALLSFGVSMNLNTDVLEVKPDGLVLMSREDQSSFMLPADVVIFTAGMKPSSIVTSLSLDKDASGRILVKRTMQSKKYPEIYALGDCSCIDGKQVPSTAQVAMQQADIVSSNLGLRYQYMKASHAEPQSRYLEKFSYVPLGEMLTLGKTNAAINSLNSNVKLAGPMASAARRLLYTFRMPTTDQQIRALVGSVSNVVIPLLRPLEK